MYHPVPGTAASPLWQLNPHVNSLTYTSRRLANVDYSLRKMFGGGRGVEKYGK